MKNELIQAIRRLAAEKNIPEESVFDILSAALASAYKKDHSEAQHVEVEIDMESGDFRVFASHEVVEEVDPEFEDLQIGLLIAKAYDPAAEIGDEVMVDVTPKDFGRIAAQTAKQVVMQRIKEVERDIIFEEFNDKVNEIISGQIRKVEARHVIINIGRTDGIMPRREQIPGEHYYGGQRIRVLLKEVSQTTKGPQIILSRADEEFIRRLFELEIPEIYSGAVEIKGIAREAGRRTKIAVSAIQDGVDPVGACVGQRGSRIQVIMAELGNEKIDIIGHDADPGLYIANSLKPAQINQVILDRTNDRAIVIVPEDQLSLAIGREGQNVRIASKLVGWQLDIKTPEEAREILDQIAAQQEEAADEVIQAVQQMETDDDDVEDLIEDEADASEANAPEDDTDSGEDIQAEEAPDSALTSVSGIGPALAGKLEAAGFATVADLANATASALATIKGISAEKAQTLIDAAKAQR